MDLQPSIARYAWTVALAYLLAILFAMALPSQSASNARLHQVVAMGERLLAFGSGALGVRGWARQHDETLRPAAKEARADVPEPLLSRPGELL